MGSITSRRGVAMNTKWISAVPSRRPGARTDVTAFTLIELLVVVAIIALLISILLPSLTAAREQSRAIKCMANLRSMGQGIMSYALDHLGTLPGPLHPPVYRLTGGDDQFSPMDPNTQRPWFLLARLSSMFTTDDEMLQYVDRVATCPTAVGRFPDKNFLPNINGNPSWSHPYNYVINSWSNSDPKWFFGWTNIGVTWTGWCNGYAADPNSPSYQPPKKIEKIKRVGDEWAVGDAWWAFRRVMIRPGVFQDTMLGPWQLAAANPLNPVGMSHNPLPRLPYHKRDRETNLLYFDGHCGNFVGVDRWAEKFPANRPPITP